MSEPIDPPCVLDRVELPDLAVIQDIGRALDARDDAGIWDAARRAESPALFYEQLRSQVGNKVVPASIKRLNGKLRADYQCSMLLVPVVLPAADRTLACDPDTIAPVIVQVKAWLQEWLGFHTHVSMYNTLFDYAEISMWTPSLMQARLMRLIDQKGRDAAAPQPHRFELPDDAPSLAFFVAAVMQTGTWPVLPPLDAAADMTLQARISGALQFCRRQRGHEQVEVLVPGFASDAIAAGIDHWLARIASEFGLRRWDVQQADQDVVVLQLEVGELPERAAAIPLRAHQLGLDGLEQRLQRVATIAQGYFTQPQ